jgi:carbon-monoxide dehydrogenase large subunit
MDQVIDKARAVAARLLEVAHVDVELVEGRFTVKGTDRCVDWARVAAEAGGFSAANTLSAQGATFPNSAHVCEAEIDQETGRVAVVGYWVVDDVGRVVNPLLLHGQIHGGVAQGLGQVLGEDLRYDAEGQLLTGSFMDYAMPRSDDIPALVVESLPVPTAMNPLGVKGAGEAGCVGALPAAVNAIVDALQAHGVSHFDMPATPEKIWRMIRAGDAR